jgi:formate hydrogenlyase subunit 6/NADH:ubiquinone oxidoreductase subunit I
MTIKEYFGNITEAVSTLAEGGKLTLRHLKKSIFQKRLKNTIPSKDENYFKEEVGIVTLQYPKEKLPIPEVGRNQLHVEIEDCIVCDKCAKICPVNCIEIESIKATEQIGTTSDGTPIRLYATKFDIDMAKCCFCGLCTTVCPTECITMSSEYDHSVFNLSQLNFPFSNMTIEEVEKVKTEKIRADMEKQATLNDANKEKTGAEETAKPILKAEQKIEQTESIESKEDTKTESGAKPVFKPKFKPIIKR